MITPDQMQAWLAHPVTMAVFEITDSRVQIEAEQLSVLAGLDSGMDRFHAGFIAGLRELKEIPKEFQIEEKTSDESSGAEVDYTAG